mmetsp:Transcript_18762/g.57704  ORF Transcript_18762/g.57704 Transcript_18762/m.57704 type:complete len:279 (-) Transcript_18762:881-1717(-)
MMRRSTQKSSTCSRLQGSKAPPSCSVLAPNATDPALHSVESGFSTERPPAAVMRTAPRCASCVNCFTTTRAPLPNLAAYAPTLEASAKTWTPSWGVTSLRSIRVFGTTSSGSGAIGSACARRATSNNFSFEISTGVPSLNFDGAHATMADGKTSLPKSKTCAQRSRATAFTSSKVSDSTAATVAACAVAGSMNVCSHATDSIKWVTWSEWSNWSPIAANCSESVTNAVEKRSSSEYVTPNWPMRRVSRNAATTASSHREASAVMSREQTAQASLEESR